MDDEISWIAVGHGPAGRRIALQQRPGRMPGLFWLGGFRSDMEGSKAKAIDALGAEQGLAVTRFDYSGHGRSGGAFADGTISRWLEETEAAVATTTGPQILIGSSMGGWLALLLGRKLRQSAPGRLKGLVLIAPAVDMTQALMEAQFTETERAEMAATGRVTQASDYAAEPDIITRGLIEDGRQHLMLGAAIEIGAPIHILQGGRDTDVPQAHALNLVAHLLTDPVSVTLIPDGDHRLSRDQDLAKLREIVLDAVMDL